MNAINRFGRGFRGAACAAFMLMSCVSPAVAQHRHDEAPEAKMSGDQKRDSGALLAAVRAATERFKDPAAAEAEDYHLQFGCVSGPDAGAMGMHFVNGPLVADGELDVAHPEIVLYEPLPGGRLKLVGADFLVLADAWNATHASPPELMGQLFHLFESPNRFGLPAFYTLHVWAWKDSPTGSFVNWHSNISCNAFGGVTP